MTRTNLKAVSVSEKHILAMQANGWRDREYSAVSCAAERLASTPGMIYSREEDAR
ncbi:MAG: hypothetical protein WAQ57_00300 [Candidatus Saccharimonadales bacterium]